MPKWNSTLGALKKHNRDPESIEVKVNKKEALDEDNILAALEGLSEHVGKVSEGSDADETHSISGIICIMTASWDNIINQTYCYILGIIRYLLMRELIKELKTLILK